MHVPYGASTIQPCQSGYIRTQRKGEQQVSHVACVMQGVSAHRQGARSPMLADVHACASTQVKCEILACFLALETGKLWAWRRLGGGGEKGRQREPNKLCWRSFKPLYRFRLSKSLFCFSCLSPIVYTHVAALHFLHVFYPTCLTTLLRIAFKTSLFGN